MKQINLLKYIIVLCAFFGCTESQINDEQLDVDSLTANLNEPCFSTTLIAGQHHEAGSVTVDIEDDNLIITYTSNGEWVIGTTHLSIGNCDDDWAPLTGSGNPQVGQFEYTEPFSSGPYEVVYVISLDGLDDNYCFAAHAEVEGPTGGETAWAEGSQFDGNGWAMFVEATLSECEEDDGNNTPF
ncbi:hypothetical protein [Psychroserpens luteolus]|uniref:hypothetical protein n=1 Tax=Psychroserpens luteolus TaxID=2855840 RepID=UPI001E2FDEA8|nr:hypothetical protein [Psychroserpens luteolus]MCD2258036.1 hypothetical protein [Psychroserpens luteolus]